MDLGAYMKIGQLGQIAKENGIDIPRLRGYRLMSDEERMSQEDIDEMKKNSEAEMVSELCRAEPFWSPKANVWSCDCYTDYLQEYYLGKNLDKIRWDRIHGWKRRVLKFEIKKQKRRIQKQWDIFNKYVGRDDVLYIHARIGGNNWSFFGGPEKVAKQPWFLERVDDYFDSTYCDIYAKIDPATLSVLESEV